MKVSVAGAQKDLGVKIVRNLSREIKTGKIKSIFDIDFEDGFFKVSSDTIEIAR